MITINKTENEKERLKSLRSYKIIKDIPEIDFDDITALATQICKTNIAYISLIDDEKQWFKSTVGFDLKSTPRNVSICAYAINFPEDMFIIPNLLEDNRFFDHPLAVGPAKIRFYASVPLVNPDGYVLGTICVLDKKERKLTVKQIEAMYALSRQVMNALEVRKYQSALEKNNNILKAKTDQFEQFALETTEKLSSPLNSISMLIDMLNKHIAGCNKEKSMQYSNMIEEAAKTVAQQIEKLQTTYRQMDIISKVKTKIDFNSLIHKLIEQDIVIKQKASIILPKQTEFFFENEELLARIMEETIKLITAVNQKSITRINIALEKTKEDILIKMTDDSDRGVDLNRDKNSPLEFIYLTTEASKWTYKLVYNERIGHLMKLIIPR